MAVGSAHRLALAGLALVVGAPIARGSPEFPRVIQQTLDLSYQPACTLCHGQGQTGFGTVTTTFGMTMLNLGVIAASDRSIRSALAALRVQNSPLITDLIAGRDPNHSDPSYGCSSTAASSFTPSGGVLYLAALILWLAVRREARSDRCAA